MQVSAALVWPALALVFAGAFAGLWQADRSRRHLLGFGIGFFALFLAMTIVIAFPQLTGPYVLAPLHSLSCISIIAIVWGAAARLNQRVPIGAMSVLTLIACVLLFVALDDAEHPVALLVQNSSSGLLFGIGAVSLWMARSVNMLDRALVWTMSLIAGFSLMRPIVLFYFHIEIAPLVERKIEIGAINVVILTVLTVILGLVLVAIAILEALEIRDNSEHSDPITGFLDQRTFQQLCEPALSKAQRLNMPVTLAIIQLDWFDNVMEKWGPDTSDMVIREISDVVRSWQRDSDVIGRVGENQLGILFVGVGAKSAQNIVSRLRADIDQACNDRMSGLLKFTLSSSLQEAEAGMRFRALMREAISPLARSKSLGSNISFLNGIEMQSATYNTVQDGAFVSHG